MDVNGPSISPSKKKSNNVQDPFITVYQQLVIHCINSL